MNANILSVLLLRRAQKRKFEAEEQSRKRRWCVLPLNQTRDSHGEFRMLLSPMTVIDPEHYFRYFRMSRDSFEELLNLVGPKITHSNTHSLPIGPAERLSLTLHLLASGDSLTSLAFSYRMGKSTVSAIFSETCIAIWECLKDTCLKPPDGDD